MVWYFDYVLKNVQLADIFHIIFFDIPFNLLIAILFLKYYSVAKKTYALLISIAWFGYTILVPIFFYFSGTIPLFIVSIIPMIIMLVGFLWYYQTPTGQSIFEVEPIVERDDDTPRKHNLKPGMVYLIEEEKSSKGFDIFTDSIFHGIRGLCITRTIPSEAKEIYGIEKSPLLWLTHIHTDLPVLDPGELEQLYSTVSKFIASAKEQHVKGATSEPIEGDKEPEEQIKSPETQVEPKEDKKMGGFETVGGESSEAVENKPAPVKQGFTTIGGDNETEKVESSEVKEEVKQSEEKKESVSKTVEAESKKEQVKQGFTTIGGKEDAPKDEELKKDIQSEEKKESVSKTVETESKNEQVKQGFTTIGGEDKTPNTEEELKKNVQDNKVKIEATEIKEVKPFENKGTNEVNLADNKKEEQNNPVKTEEHVESVISNFKKHTEMKEAQKEQKKNEGLRKMGVTIIGDDEASTEHKAEMVVEQDDSQKSVILLDGLEYLINNNSFNAVLHVVQLLKDHISEGDSALVLPVNPKTMKEQEISILRQELELFSDKT